MYVRHIHKGFQIYSSGSSHDRIIDSHNTVDKILALQTLPTIAAEPTDTKTGKTTKYTGLILEPTGVFLFTCLRSTQRCRVPPTYPIARTSNDENLMHAQPGENISYFTFCAKLNAAHKHREICGSLRRELSKSFIPQVYPQAVCCPSAEDLTYRRMSKSQLTHSPSHPSNSPSTKDCQVCKKFKSNSSVINICFEVDQALFEKVVGSNKRRKLDKKEPLENFLKAINALLNEGSGFVYVHTEKPSLLALFDEQVDSKMNSLIADDSLFHHNFHRFYYDNKHVCFSVKQYSRDHISTLCFNTKVSLNSGLTDPNPAQMRRLLQSNQSGSQTSSETEISDHMETSLVKISKDSLVYIKTSRGIFVFNENVCTQAKQIPEGIINIRNRKEFIEKLKNYVWDKSSNYITAFSKVHSGGSIYFGLSENEEDLKNQETISQSDKTRTRRSGSFKYTGVVLRKQEQEEIKKMVELKVQKEMLFLGKNGWYNPVSVVYHSVEGGEADLSVIEVKVRQFHGVVFNSKLGPQSYNWNRRTEQCDVMSPTNWIKYHKSEFSPCIP